MVNCTDSKKCLAPFALIPFAVITNVSVGESIGTMFQNALYSTIYHAVMVLNIILEGVRVSIILIHCTVHTG